MAIKIVYTFFLALLIAFFVGLGIDAFYPTPKEPPTYPIVLQNIPSPECKCQMTEEQKTAQEKYDKEQKQYREDTKSYNRTVSMIALISAIIVLVASLTLLSKIKMIADGILLGGVFTTAYSIIRSLMSEDSRFRFIIITIGLAIAIALGYLKFIRPKENQE